mmetsp:Transcript_35663/g.79332  ORF Transcript_35663/g.79332 Transcript_35663/m.79332 type:complete len:141 (+) Transcript_35663:290-712(+)
MCLVIAAYVPCIREWLQYQAGAAVPTSPRSTHLLQDDVHLLPEQLTPPSLQNVSLPHADAAATGQVNMQRSFLMPAPTPIVHRISELQDQDLGRPSGRPPAGPMRTISVASDIELKEAPPNPLAGVGHQTAPGSFVRGRI